MKNSQIKISIITFLIFVVISAKTQNHREPRLGFLLTTATIQYGIPTSKLLTPTWYLTMRTEGFIEKNISIAGRLDISMPKKFRYNDVLENYSGYFGINYHLLAKYFDGYIGFQPGVALTKTTFIDYNLEDKSKYIVSPLISTTLGARYYLGSIFNVFGTATYSYGFQLSNQTNLPLSEFRIAAGLGFNLNVVKKRKS